MGGSRRDPRRSLVIGSVIAGVILAALVAMLLVGLVLVFAPRRAALVSQGPAPVVAAWSGSPIHPAKVVGS